MYYNQFKYLEKLPDIKIFLSSTFRDLNLERETLIKKVFPKIEADLRAKGINISVIDLRWGIKEEDIHSGDTLSLCLENVDKCKPYFIGLLGGRYGWIPTKNDVYQQSIFYQSNKEVVDSYINDKKSITEMEIRFGVLDRIDINTITTRFYFGDDEVYMDNKDHYNSEKDYNIACQKQKKLKNEIKKVEGIFGATFKSIEDISTIIAKDIELLINDSIDKELNKFNIKLGKKQLSDAEQKYLEQYCFEKQKIDGYLERECDKEIKKYIKSINNSNKNIPLIVRGESGVGKSAVLAKTSMDIREKSDVELIRCYIGSQSGISTQSSILESILTDIKEIYSIDKEIPNEAEKLIDAFNTWLNEINKPTLIIIDGINQIEYNECALEFLPNTLPKNVGLIISVNHDIILGKKQFNTIDVGYFTKHEKKEYIISYLKKYSKDIEPALLYFLAEDVDEMQRILGEKITISNTLMHSNPNYMKILLNEICLTGKQTLDINNKKMSKKNYQKRILSKLLARYEMKEHKEITDILSLVKYYWYTDNLKDFFIKILERYEYDYGKDLVKEVCSLITLSRDGLLHKDLSKILLDDRKHNALLFYSLLSLLEDKLVKIQGQYTAYHSYVLDAIKEKYGDFETEGRKILEKYFAKACAPRKFDEDDDIFIHRFVKRFVPTTGEDLLEYTYQLIKLNKWSEWWKIITVPEFLPHYRLKCKDEIVNNIDNVVKKLDRTYENLFIDLVQSIIEKDESILKLNYSIWWLLESLCKSWIGVGDLLVSNYEFNKGIKTYEKVEKEIISIYGDDCTNTWDILLRLGDSYKDYGDFYNALRLFEKVEKKAVQYFGDTDSNILGLWVDIGLVYLKIQEFNKAIILFDKVEKKVDESIDEEDIKVLDLWVKLGNAYSEIQQFDKALILYEKTEARLLKKDKENIHLWTIWTNIGNIYARKKQYEKAIDIFVKVEKDMLRKNGENDEIIWVVRKNLALAYLYYGDYYNVNNNINKAMELYQTAISLSKSLVVYNSKKIGVYFEILENYVDLAVKMWDGEKIIKLKLDYLDFIEQRFKLSSQYSNKLYNLMLKVLMLIESQDGSSNPTNVCLLFGRSVSKDALETLDDKKAYYDVNDYNINDYIRVLGRADRIILVISKDAIDSDINKAIMIINASSKVSHCYSIINSPNNKLIYKLSDISEVLVYNKDYFKQIDMNQFIYQVTKIFNCEESQGLIRIDSADIKSVINSGYSAQILVAESYGQNKYADIVCQLKPMLERESVSKMILYVISDTNVGLIEMSDLQMELHENTCPDAEIIFGIEFDETFNVTDGVYCIIIYSTNKNERIINNYKTIKTQLTEEDLKDIYLNALEAIFNNKTCTPQILQQKMRIGYIKATNIIFNLEILGIVAKDKGDKSREILVPYDTALAIINNKY